MGLLYYISYAAILAAFAFVTLSLASGLLYVSELIEEHSRLAKVIGQRGIYFIMALHVILYFSDSLPFLQTIFSIICHVVYLQNFSATWPIISLTSASFLASCVFVITDHFLWFFYFARVTQEARHLRTYRGPVPNTPGFVEIASFFGICVWLAPLFLFLSLSANDNALPVSAAEPGTPSSMQFSQTRVSLFRSLFSFEFLPSIRPKGPRRNNSEGLLAPQPSRLPMPPPSPIPSSTFNAPPPPRSPGPRYQEIDAYSSPSQNFQLNTPPRRMTPIRRQTGTTLSQKAEASNIGLRKTSSNNVTDDDNMYRVI